MYIPQSLLFDWLESSQKKKQLAECYRYTTADKLPVCSCLAVSVFVSMSVFVSVSLSLSLSPSLSLCLSLSLSLSFTGARKHCCGAEKTPLCTKNTVWAVVKGKPWTEVQGRSSLLVWSFTTKCKTSWCIGANGALLEPHLLWLWPWILCSGHGSWLATSSPPRGRQSPPWN